MLDPLRLPGLKPSPDRYGLALAIVAMATALRFALEPLIAGRLPFITLFPALLAIALYCGLRPAMMALFLSTAVGVYLVRLDSALMVWGGVLFLLIGGASAYFMHLLRIAVVELRAKERQITMINEELAHRLRNVFAIASSVCAQTIRADLGKTEMISVVQSRLAAIAAGGSLLRAGTEEGADVVRLVELVVRPLCPSADRLDVRGDHVEVLAGDTTALALILHELGTNALKHGAWKTHEGRVELRWSRKVTEGRDALVLVWRERGGPPVAGPVSEGVGSGLIKHGISHGSIDWSLRPEGLVCSMELQLPASYRVAARRPRRLKA